MGLHQSGETVQSTCVPWVRASLMYFLDLLQVTTCSISGMTCIPAARHLLQETYANPLQGHQHC